MSNLPKNVELRNGKTYFVDQIEPSRICYHEITGIIADHKSPYQHIQIFDTPKYGKMLVLDGDIQLSQKDNSDMDEIQNLKNQMHWGLAVYEKFVRTVGNQYNLISK